MRSCTTTALWLWTVFEFTSGSSSDGNVLYGGRDSVDSHIRLQPLQQQRPALRLSATARSCDGTVRSWIASPWSVQRPQSLCRTGRRTAKIEPTISRKLSLLGHDDGCRSGRSMCCRCCPGTRESLRITSHVHCFSQPLNQRSLERQSLWLRDHNIGATTWSMSLPAWRWSLSHRSELYAVFGIGSIGAVSRAQQEDSAASLNIKPWET